MALLKKIKSILKKKPVKTPTESEIQAGPPKSKKVLAGKPPLKKQRFKEIYKILKEPHISERATVLGEKNKYIFKVYPLANKVEAKKAIESLYGVKVRSVNIINVHRKRKVFRGIQGFKTGYKKAIVTLEKGHKIEILPH